MNKYIIDKSLILTSLFFFLNSTVALKIIKCDSNQITTISYNKTTNKAIIKFEESKYIQVSENNPAKGGFSLFCISDTNFETCSLTHESTTKCNYSVPLQCTDKGNCQNNKITYEYENNKTEEYKDSKKCSFTLSEISAAGKH